MTIVDTHAHLDHLEGVEQALAEAASAGVEAIAVMGEDLMSNQRHYELAQRVSSPKILLGLGFHPSKTDEQDLTECLTWIQSHIHEAKAIGEIGLDYWYKGVKKDAAKKERMRTVFSAMLALAKEHNLPVSIHSRGAWRDCFEMTVASGIRKAVFHWYSGPLDVLDTILEAGYCISATPSLVSSAQAQEAIKHAPIERTLIETDSPVYYRQPQTQAGFRAAPKDVWRTLDYYCQIKRVAKEDALQILNANAWRIFGKIEETSL